MGVSFLQPIYLYALAAAAVPLVIHLIHRRRARERDFPSLRFILSSQRRIARRHRLHQWLLMALRLAAVCLFALVLAGAVLTGQKDAASGSRVPTASVVILDDTVSMRFVQGGLERFILATRAAREIFEEMTDADRAAIITVSGAYEASGGLLDEKALLLSRLDGIAPSYRSGDIASALRKAYELLSGAPEEKRIIWLISDMARHGWRGFSLAAVGKTDAAVELRCLRVGGELRDANAAVIEASVSSHRLERGVPATVEATVANFSDEEMGRVVVQLLVDRQRRETKLVDVPRDGRRTVEFRTELEDVGLHSATVELPKDGLAADDAFHLTLETVEKIHVLLVDGDPKTSLVRSETYYLVSALNPELSQSQAAILPAVVTVEELSRTALDPFQVVVLCNVREVPEGVRARLMTHVLGGGGLIIFMGDQVDVPSYNRSLYASDTRLLPAPLDEGSAEAWEAPARIASVAYDHPILRVFEEEGAGDFGSTRFYRYAVLAAPAESSAKSLLTLGDGSPYLIEGRVGKGRVLIYTSTADRDWNDMCARPIYVPLMQQSVKYAAGLLTAAEEANGLVNEPIQFAAPADAVGKALRITDPMSRSATVWFEREGDGAMAVYPESSVPGVYRVEGEGMSSLYAVNLSREESDLAKMGEEELRVILPGVPLSVGEYSGAGSALRAGIATTRDLSTLLLLALGIVLVAEGLLANKG